MHSERADALSWWLSRWLHPLSHPNHGAESDLIVEDPRWHHAC